MLGKRWTVLAIGAILIVTVGLWWFSRLTGSKQLIEKPADQPESQNMKVRSSAFTDGGVIPDRYTCRGNNINPPLSIGDVPKGTKTLALVVDDPDAPLGTFTHWLVWNIAPTTAEIAEGSLPTGAQEGTNSAEKTGYFGPCPPARHRYFFKLYALDAQLGLDGKAKVSDLEAAVKGHIIAETRLIGVYGR